ncbi:MAG: hypothetical protein EHM38_10475 [Geobacteraceae bacterium]|nr:MAG: hypothetical protein EHM38_10475 [Geobacteraceae bacterium]
MSLQEKTIATPASWRRFYIFARLNQKENSRNIPIQDPPGAIPLLFPGALLISGQWFPEVGRFCPFFLSSHGSGVDN